ncbi:MAG: CoA-binding protein [Candidatus Helarchaeota archaeon]
MTAPFPVKTLFEPKSVAVLGASRTKGRPGNVVVKNLVEIFNGPIYPINPHADNLYGLKVYPDIFSVGEVECAIIILPTDLVVDAVEDCIKKGIKSVIIITEGFAETGTETGKNYQNKLKKLSNKINILGTGTLGVVNLPVFTSTYVEIAGLKQNGNIAFVSQSGIFTGGMIEYFRTHNFNMSKIVSLGNKIGIDDADIIDYLYNDGITNVICLYLEGISNGKRFINSARKFIRDKGPIIVLKGGKSPSGIKAAMSHTSSIAINNDIFDSIIKQTGIIQVEDLNEFIYLSKAFSLYNKPIQGNKIAIITYSGALGVLTSDQCTKYGLKLANFTEQTQKRIKEVVFDRNPANNPVDTYPATLKKGTEKTFITCLEAVMEDPGVDCAILTAWGSNNPDNDEVKYSEHLKDTILKYQSKNKPTIVAVIGEKDGIERQRKFFEDNNIINVEFPDEAPKIISKMYNYYHFKNNILLKYY